MNKVREGDVGAMLWALLLMIIGIWHPYVTAVGPETAAAIASLLTGMGWFGLAMVVES